MDESTLPTMSNEAARDDYFWLPAFASGQLSVLEYCNDMLPCSVEKREVQMRIKRWIIHQMCLQSVMRPH